jgi:hypothetical protein
MNVDPPNLGWRRAQARARREQPTQVHQHTGAHAPPRVVRREGARTRRAPRARHGAGCRRALCAAANESKAAGCCVRAPASLSPAPEVRGGLVNGEQVLDADAKAAVFIIAGLVAADHANLRRSCHCVMV